LPHAEAALEDYRTPVVRDARPEHAPVGELRHLPGLPAGRELPDVLRAAAVGHEVQALPAVAPHRPDLFRAAVGQALVPAGRVAAHQHDDRLVNVRVAVTPPLHVTLADESH